MLHGQKNIKLVMNV